MSPDMLQCVLHSLLTLIQTASPAKMAYLWNESDLAIWRNEVKEWTMETLANLENSVGEQKKALGKLATFVLIDILEHEKSHFLQNCMPNEDGIQVDKGEFAFQMPGISTDILR
jgi:hypothetical protein